MWTRDEIVDIADDSIDASGVRDDTDESVKADLEGLDAQHRALVEIVTQQQAVIDAQSRQIDALNSSMTAAENSLSAIENRLQM